MTEVAMVKILLSMECLKLFGGKPQMNIQGWEDFRSEFKVTAIEWGKSRLKSGGSTWYIRIGETQYTPTKLYSMWKQGIVVPPSINCRRKATKFIREELSKILLSDKICDVILKYTHSREETRTEAEENSEDEEEKESDTTDSQNEE
jgi:hypothetical protein